jgi:hypothetical protein
MRQDVNGTTPTGDRERRFNFELPATRSEALNEVLHEACVRLIEQAVKPFPVPPEPDVELSVERLADPSEFRERDGAHAPAFDPGDR